MGELEINPHIMLHFPGKKVWVWNCAECLLGKRVSSAKNLHEFTSKNICQKMIKGSLFSAFQLSSFFFADEQDLKLHSLKI